MKITNHKGWHSLTYTLLYPAVLGSMLYDLLHVSNIAEGAYILKLSITLFYCLDFMHLDSDLKSNKEGHENPLATVIDLLVALLLGLAFWYAEEPSYPISYLLWGFVGLLFFIYTFSQDSSRIKKDSGLPKFAQWTRKGYYLFLTVALFIVAFLVCNLSLIWLLTILPLFFTSTYAIYVFTYGRK